MKKIDVFLSYEHNMKSVVDRICSVLENDNIRCWYAPRDVIGDYATSIVNAIDEASIFVVVLNNAASKSVHVLNEVEMAYKRIVDKEDALTILPFKLDKDDLSRAMEYYIKRLHWIDASAQGIDKAILELKNKIVTILRPDSIPKAPVEKRTKNTYYNDENEDERERLKLQKEILQQFDENIYDDVCSRFETLKVLDLGSSNGDFILDKMGNRANLEYLLGVDFDQTAVDNANAKCVNKNIRFIQCDLDSENVSEDLVRVCDEFGKRKFNIINISMLLLHLENPLNLLRAVRKVAETGALLIVKDIDDGQNIAFPDPEGKFQHAIKLCAQNPFSGYRLSGREVPYLLKKSGYKDIKLLKCGLDSLGMDYDEKAALFDIYFPFSKAEFATLAERFPDNSIYAENSKWFADNYSYLQNSFMNEDFFFSLGFMLFTATK